MAAFEVLALDPTTPQIRAPGAADTYSFPRNVSGNITLASGGVFQVPQSNRMFGSTNSGAAGFGMSSNLPVLLHGNSATEGVQINNSGVFSAVIAADAANTLAQRNGTNAQTFRVYGTFTDASNYERGYFTADSNGLTIGHEALGTGTKRPVRVVGPSLAAAEAVSVLDMSQTWNTTGTPTALKLNVTDTASNAASLLMDLQRGGTTQFAVQKDAGGYVVDGSYGLRRTTNVAITITGGTTGGASIDLNGTFVSLNRIVLNRALQDCGIARKAAGVTEINNGTAGTYAGTAFTTGSQTVAQLPAAATAGAGARAFVTDATATTFLSTVAGGGANAVPVVSNGTNWLIG